MRYFLYTIVYFISGIVLAQTSVLSAGEWYKVGVTQTGVHKIDKTTLDLLGVPSNIDPRKIKIFGNGFKGKLPQLTSESRPIGLLENAVSVVGEEDGTFDSGDYILFYAVSSHLEAWTDEGFSYEKNIYSDTAYYFLQISDTNGKRIQPKENLSGEADRTATTFDDHIFFEEDINNLISSGRGWYGPIINSGDDLKFPHEIEGLRSDINLVVSGVSQSDEDANFIISTNEAQIGALPFDAVPSGPGTTYSIKARQSVDTFSIGNQSSTELAFLFEGNDSGARGYLDFYYLTFERDLRLYNVETAFRVGSSLGELIKYEIDNAIGSTIWNLTDLSNIKSQSFSVANNKASFQSQSSDIEEFVIFQGNDFPTPFIFGSVPNQNLRGNTNFDGLIVTHPKFLSAAKRLAQFHSLQDGLNVQVATTQEVYNEFSGGRQDLTAIRDYSRYLYNSGGNLKYLLLLGDCSYDYKDRIINNTNYVPTYESRQSFHPIFSYSSDDYFGFLEDGEGIWEETRSGDHDMEIGVGRLPAKSIEEADAMVDKIIYYCTSPNTLGKWRSEITYVADDGDGNIHARHVEDLSELIDTTYAQYKINKVLLDAFVQEGTGSSEQSPQARSALKTRIKNGTFAVNFIGHGNERLWMEEEIFTDEDISELTNRNKLPIFVTATCEFGRYDDPLRTSGAEELLLLTQGGGIALLTTSRPVFASTNFSLNQAFHENIFEKEGNENLRLGDVIRLTKNEGLEGAVNRNFTLLGDPMMMPAYPKLDITLDMSNLDTLSALDEVILTGRVEESGVLAGGFNGTLLVGVFDTEQSFKTLGQESDRYSYDLRSNAIFRGEADVIDGEFSLSFIVPKNISYQYQKGKISLYAWDEENNSDAGGASRDFVIGGSNPNPESDENPPLIRAFMNDVTFQNGSTVGDSPLLVAQLEDESGITTTSTGVIQGITLRIGDEVINLNDFYTADANSFEKGTVVYPLQDLAPGDYSIILKVWDTHNNTTEKIIDFKVSDEPILFVYNPLAYPNPIRESTTFAFEHDREDEDLLVTLLVYGSRGEVVSKKELLFENSGRSIGVEWRAQANSGEKLTGGIYYSRLIIKSKLDGATKEISQKLVIVN